MSRKSRFEYIGEKRRASSRSFAKSIMPVTPKGLDLLALSPLTHRGGHVVFTLHAVRVNRRTQDAMSELSDFGRLHNRPLRGFATHREANTPSEASAEFTTGATRPESDEDAADMSV